ncbi:phosphotransferase [Nocardioides silvaticus]|uniref:Phosphotransferase n=1 Tax=Nocardioides silvaticus TaxID=2201891 RepID=A0A316TAP9_9ACTN|nr:phosphotransferase [Nocardioides silvaticus]PWN01413.1 phosphotransferase [Nocardioides silvaticus]
MHADELAVDADLVRRLLWKLFPDLAELPIRQVSDSGSSNSLYRLGEALAVRLPRQPGGGDTIVKEAAWLPYLASRLTVNVPDLVGVGVPGHGYSEVWAVTSWLDGSVPRARLRGAEAVALAQDLARFILDLRHVAVPSNSVEDAAELSTYRGAPLPSFDDDFRGIVDACRDLNLNLDLEQVLHCWETATAAASEISPTTLWYYGDLLAENVLLDKHGRLAAVLDFGGLGLGNPEVDLVIAWDLLDPEGLVAFRRALGIQDAQWSASRGWALFLALMTFPYYGSSMPNRCASRLAMVHAVLADA